MAPTLSLERLEALITGATEGNKRAPDLTLTLEICEWVKNKANGPVFLTSALFKRIHGRNQQVALLALNVLDICVKNCGVPLHLHIGSKKFLNELVRFFPATQPTPRPPVMERILELIQLWHAGLVPKSRHKDDLQSITSMYKLLKNKGYTFPPYKESEASLIIADPVLLTEEELEKEDHLAQAAKLDELLRRGSPEDLEAANQLMKLMAGYDPETKPDYKKQVDSQLKKIEQSCQELLDLVRSITPDENIESYNLLDELANVCRASQPKIQSFIAEETDGKRMEHLLELNDRMNSALLGYEALRSHKPVPASVMESTTPAPQPQQPQQQYQQQPQQQQYQQQQQQHYQPPQPQQQQAVSLLDLDDVDFGSANKQNQNHAATSLAADLGGLSLGASPSFQPAFAAANPAAAFGFATSPMQQPAPQQQQQNFFQQQQPPVMQQQQPNFFQQPPQQANFFQQPPVQQQQQQPVQQLPAFSVQAAPAPAPAPAPIPAPVPVQAAPVVVPLIPMPAPSFVPVPVHTHVVAPAPAPAAPAPAPALVSAPVLVPVPTPNAAASSAAAALSTASAALQQQQHTVTGFENDAVSVQLQLEKHDDQVHCLASIFNKLPSAIINVTLQLAVPRTQKLKLEPMSSGSAAPASMGGRPITQKIIVENPTRVPVRLRFRLSYDVPGKQSGIVEQGEFANIPAFYG